MRLSKDNYFSPEASAEYMSVSQFKAFKACEAAALAEIRGEYKRPDTKALQMGSYVDAFFSGEDMDEYRVQHPELINSRTGALKADFKQCDEIIDAARADEMFMSYTIEAPRHQEILTGYLFGIPWKIKVDALHPDKIIDFKLMRDFEPIWRDGQRQQWWRAWEYDLQGWVYREIVRQHTGRKLPFILAAMTKQDPSDRALLEISDEHLNINGPIVEHYAERFQKIKAGEIQPTRCEGCAYCRATRKITKVETTRDLIQKEMEGEIE